MPLAELLAGAAAFVLLGTFGAPAGWGLPNPFPCFADFTAVTGLADDTDGDVGGVASDVCAEASSDARQRNDRDLRREIGNVVHLIGRWEANARWERVKTLVETEAITSVFLRRRAHCTEQNNAYTMCSRSTRRYKSSSRNRKATLQIESLDSMLHRRHTFLTLQWFAETHDNCVTGPLDGRSSHLIAHEVTLIQKTLRSVSSGNTLGACHHGCHGYEECPGLQA